MGATAISTPEVSLLIPTKNGARFLPDLLAAATAQQGVGGEIEIIAVDSGSRDSTLEILRGHGARIVSIPPREFSHGGTRNLAASHAGGQFLVFTTQDAVPANSTWLRNLLAPFANDPLVAGTFSRQLPRPYCHPMERRRIEQMEPSGKPESRVNQMSIGSSGAPPGDWYFFSNVSSAIPRRVWEEWPLPEVEFAEDQLWAKQVIEAGYKTVYEASSLVYHSHGYGAWRNMQRHFDHARAVRRLFNPGPRAPLKGQLTAALATARQDLSYWRWLNKQGRLEVLARWGVRALSWHVAAVLGTWLGEREGRLPGLVVPRLSLQERLKRA